MTTAPRGGPRNCTICWAPPVQPIRLILWKRKPSSTLIGENWDFRGTQSAKILSEKPGQRTYQTPRPRKVYRTFFWTPENNGNLTQQWHGPSPTYHLTQDLSSKDWEPWSWAMFLTNNVAPSIAYLPTCVPVPCPALTGSKLFMAQLNFAAMFSKYLWNLLNFGTRFLTCIHSMTYLYVFRYVGCVLREGWYEDISN